MSQNVFRYRGIAHLQILNNSSKNSKERGETSQNSRCKSGYFR